MLSTGTWTELKSEVMFTSNSTLPSSVYVHEGKMLVHIKVGIRANPLKVSNVSYVIVHQHVNLNSIRLLVKELTLNNVFVVRYCCESHSALYRGSKKVSWLC